MEEWKENIKCTEKSTYASFRSGNNNIHRKINLKKKHGEIKLCATQINGWDINFSIFHFIKAKFLADF